MYTKGETTPVVDPTTINRPSSNKKMMIGASQNFFRTRKNAQISFTISIFHLPLAREPRALELVEVVLHFRWLILGVFPVARGTRVPFAVEGVLTRQPHDHRRR